jgi:hypothetical protein
VVVVKVTFFYLCVFAFDELGCLALQPKIQTAQEETTYHNCESVEELRKTREVGRNLF